MNNVYVLVTYVAALMALVGYGLLKIGDVLEKKRDQKHYQMIKEDAAFWQMKVEQSGITIYDHVVDSSINKMMDMVKEQQSTLFGTSWEAKEADDEEREEDDIVI